jgi:hypothetical protein
VTPREYAARELERMGQRFRRRGRSLAKLAETTRDPWTWGIVNGLVQSADDCRKRARELRKGER